MAGTNGKAADVHPLLATGRGGSSSAKSPAGTRWYAMVPGSRITSRVPSSEIQVFPTIFCAVFAVSDGTRWYATVSERALDHFADGLPGIRVLKIKE